MNPLSFAVEELMGATAAQAQPMGGGMGRPNIKLKQPQPGQALDPKAAQGNLGQAVQDLGQAVQGSIDARGDEQARMGGDPNMALQKAQGQPTRNLPQDRLQQQQDQTQLKKGQLPKDLDKNVAAVAVNAVRNANTKQAGGQPMGKPMESQKPKGKKLVENKADDLNKVERTNSSPDDEAGYDDMLDAVKKSTAKNKANLSLGKGPSDISSMGVDGNGRSKGYKVVTSADDLKSKDLTKETVAEAIFTSEERDELLDDIFGV